MTQQPTLADLAVEALAAVKAIGAGVGLDDAERHIVRNMKRLAERNLESSFRLAIEIAEQAAQVSKDFEQAIVAVTQSA